MTRTVWAALTLGMLGLVACAPHKNTTSTAADPDSQSLADDGTDTVTSEGDAESLTGTLVASSGSSVGLASEPVGGDLTTDNIVGAGAKLFFLPSSCLAVTNPTASRVEYNFTDCTGPRGLGHITGICDVDYTAATGTLTLALSCASLKVNRATIDWTASAVITASGANRTMDWTGHFTGTTGGGRTIERDNKKTVTWTAGDSCFTINGTSQGNVTGKDLQIDIIDYKRCKASCPEPLSEVKITRASTGRSVDITYGEGDATFTDARGDSITFVPLCESL